MSRAVVACSYAVCEAGRSTLVRLNLLIKTSQKSLVESFKLVGYQSKFYFSIIARHLLMCESLTSEEISRGTFKVLSTKGLFVEFYSDSTTFMVFFYLHLFVDHVLIVM